MNTETKLQMDFSPEEKSRLEVVFGKAFDKLRQSMPSSRSAEAESNNHFDEKFHKELTDGLHLREKSA